MLWPKLGVIDRSHQVSPSVWRGVIKKVAVSAIVPSWLPPETQLLCMNLEFALVKLWFVLVQELGQDVRSLGDVADGEVVEDGGALLRDHGGVTPCPQQQGAQLGVSQGAGQVQRSAATS